MNSIYVWILLTNLLVTSSRSTVIMISFSLALINFSSCSLSFALLQREQYKNKLLVMQLRFKSCDMKLRFNCDGVFMYLNVGAVVWWYICCAKWFRNKEFIRIENWTFTLDTIVEKSTVTYSVDSLKSALCDSMSSMTCHSFCWCWLDLIRTP